MRDKSATSWPLAFGYLAAALGIPSAVAAAWWPHIRERPMQGSLLLAGLVVVTGLIGFAHQVWARKYHDRLIDAVASVLDVKTSRFWRHYRKRMLDHVRYVDQRGHVGYFYDPELSDVYVDVTLQQAISAEVSPSVLADLPAAGERKAIDAFLGLPEPRVIAILGAPGSGKTTLLRHTALRLCRARRIRRGRTVPILLYLRDHVQAITADPKITLLALQNEGVLGRFDLTDPAGWLEQRLRAGRCVVMLDGLDEVASADDRSVVADWVRRQVSRYPGNDFLVTSRPLGYQSTPIEGAVRVLANPFTSAQIERFVHRWYLAEERHSTGADDEAVTQRARTAARNLVGRLRANPSLHRLATNPLLLTMIATVHRHMAALPGSRAQLYDQICQVLLWRRHQAKGLPSALSSDQQERLVRVLGYEMMTRNVRDLPEQDAVKIIRPVLRGIRRERTPEDVLADLSSSGVFTQWEAGRYAFAHLTFQEYLAAAHIKDKHLEGTLLSNVANPWWREATLLYVTRADATEIVEACLAEGGLDALTLAFDCEELASTLAPEVRDKLDSLLERGLAPHASEDVRRLMTGVAITRALSETVETDSGARICSNPVTNRVYQIFLDDMTAAGTPRRPDTPPSGACEPGAPARGMRGEDAVEFARWAAEHTGGQPTCRLPTKDECADQAVHDLLSRYGMFWVEQADAVGPVRSRDGTWPPQLDRTKLIRDDFQASPLALGLCPLITHLCVALEQLGRLDPDWPRPAKPARLLAALRTAMRLGRQEVLNWLSGQVALTLREASHGLSAASDAASPEMRYLVRVIKRDLDAAHLIARDCYDLRARPLEA
ncbi:MAG TPA: NACHT domain-containing protein, partial [Streptosporangiaceae bacterium]|nr:NACHT domain-containing protein [Streptosporangiaceae bacterium]